FHDTHVHPSGGIGMGECNLDGLARQAIMDSIVSCARTAPTAPWIRGRGWELPVFPAGNPRREWLDSLVPDRPVWLEAADGHSAWVSSKALELAGVTRETPDPPNGRIERDPDGRPSGTLRESAAGLVEQHLPPYTDQERQDGLLRALALANSCGITTVHDASTSQQMLAAWSALDRDGRLTARVIAAQYVSPDRGLDQVDSLVAWRRRYPRTTYFRPDAAKLFADGVIEAGTAALVEPYVGGDSRGTANFRPGQLDSLVTAIDAAGIRIHIHAIGDRAIRMALDAIQQARAENGPSDRRPIIAHLQLFDPADIPRFEALGVVASFQPLWAFADSYITDLTEPVLGPARSRWLYPIRSVVESGAVVAAGSDWTVSSMNPLEAIQVAVTRRGPDAEPGEPWIPEETVDLETMLKAYTVNGAWAALDERVTGTLEVGKRADLVVLDKNLYELPATEIGKTRVLLTLLDGKAVYLDRALR
ncbi:MAG: amidohydrolase, partial [Gemmatimonadales bacterium]